MKITYFFSALYDNFRLVTSLCFHTVLLFISLSCWTRCFSNISYLNQVCSISSLCWFAVTQKAPVSAAIFQLFFFLTQKLFQPSKAGREKQIIYGRQRESQTCSLSNSTICDLTVRACKTFNCHIGIRWRNHWARQGPGRTKSPTLLMWFVRWSLSCK